MRALLLALLLPVTAWAEGERAGAFDYYVLALSWSPSWCALEGDARGSPQCEDGTGHGWILHGLWPQYDRGWPSYCRTDKRNPSRAMTAGMADITGTGGLAWHRLEQARALHGAVGRRLLCACRARPMAGSPARMCCASWSVR